MYHQFNCLCWSLRCSQETQFSPKTFKSSKDIFKNYFINFSELAWRDHVDDDVDCIHPRIPGVEYHWLKGKDLTLLTEVHKGAIPSPAATPLSQLLVLKSFHSTSLKLVNSLDPKSVRFKGVVNFITAALLNLLNPSSIQGREEITWPKEFCSKAHIVLHGLSHLPL